MRSSYAFDAARYGWNGDWNKYLHRFEEGFAEYVGVKHAIAFSSCTGALHLALLALGIGKGDEVIVPELTWVATANAVLYTGATPIFADVEEDSWCLDAVSVADKITPRTRAVMPVHLYGQPGAHESHHANRERLQSLCGRGRRSGHRRPSSPASVGSFGHFGCFSFQGAKLLVTGEGGMLLTDDEELYRRGLQNLGPRPRAGLILDRHQRLEVQDDKRPRPQQGLASRRVEELVEAKRRIFGWYQDGLRAVPHVRLMRETPGTRSIYWMSNIYLEESSHVSRDALRAELKLNNIDTRDVFPAISQYPIWPLKQAPQPHATRVGARGINLPSGVCLKRDEVQYVCDKIRSIVTR